MRISFGGFKGAQSLVPEPFRPIHKPMRSGMQSLEAETVLGSLEKGAEDRRKLLMWALDIDASRRLPSGPKRSLLAAEVTSIRRYVW